MTDSEQKEWDLKLRKLDAEIENLRQSSLKMQIERFGYPFAVGSGFTLAAVALAKLFL